VGVPASALVLGRQSGRHALRARLHDLGYETSDEELGRVYLAFKELADKKEEVTDKDLEALVGDERRSSGTDNYTLDSVQVFCGSPAVPTATVKMTDPKGQSHIASAIGTGPVDAAYQVITQIVGVSNKLVEYRVDAVTEGLDAMAEVTLRIEKDGVAHNGRGADTDIVVASAKAYVNALNRLIATQHRAALLVKG
ncbi:MAG: 2-isopropylmalate synthase, partial [SAR202 cluster bacterium]|nr:2-isopropylmalate synthase [SAR202 cluster bacterium]